MFERSKAKQREKFDRLVEKQAKKDSEINKSKYTSITNRWVVNLSDIRLEPEADSLLKKGLNFAVTPKQIPIDEFITAAEEACQRLKPAEADQLRTETVKALKKIKNSQVQFNSR